MFNWAASRIGTWLARYLDEPTGRYVPFSVTPVRLLRQCMRPGDVLLIDGDRRFSVAIKYLTQSTWSHVALYVGDALPRPSDGSEPRVLIEAELLEGVIAVPVSKYRNFNTRICRPVGLTEEDRRKVVNFMVDRLGMQYDLKNVVDLMRYLLPTPPVPTRWRRRMLALGSGDPTRAICSTLIAQAFQSVRYPILPKVRTQHVYDTANQRRMVREILHIRHHSLFAPRDFDLSPYFEVVKPTIDTGFDYRELDWYEDQA
ncbi:MAG: YiiX/YebB-like N1pC/P60 family cysteine hydrolase, partial [Kiloniellales bacterium]